MWSTDVPTPIKLKEKLANLGVPDKNIKLDSHSFQHSRRCLSQALKCNQTFYQTVRKAWTHLRRSSSLKTIVTSDFYQLRERDLLKALDLCNCKLKKNQLEEAKTFFRYVNNMINFPAANNNTYNPEIVKHKLGSNYIALDKQLGKSSVKE